ncbi:MAG: ATP-binding protein, partial [Planctomycetota bacterium]
GHFTVKGQPDLETARRITHDEAYHKTKAAIMKPIAEFQEMLDARTEQEASQAFGRAQALFVVSQVILVGLVAATILLFELKKQQHEATALILAKYRGLFEHSRDALATLEPPSWAFTSANPATLEMFRANGQKGLFSRRLWEWSPEKQPDGRDSSEKAEEMIETAMRDGSHFFEWMHRRSDGEEFPADVLLARMREGEKVILQATVRDITDRKRTEEHLLRAQKMEAIGQLAGGVAHEIRNQLQVVLGYGEMLLRDSLFKEEGRAMLQEISKAARRSSTITGQLLAYSRRETLRPVVVSIRDCMAEIGKLLPHMIGEDIRMMIQSSTDECRATIEPHLFQQAILNLATNARDAMPKGGTLTIETGRVTLGPESRQIDPDLAEGPYVVVTISDTGSGMSKATLALVFDPFFTTKEVGKGTGLGLPMIQGFVKQSGGTVAIQSELGRGTTVRLYFSPAAAAMVPAAEPGRQPALTLRGVGETLLLVEDEPAVRAVTVELLRTAGYRVLTAADAEEALPLAERYDGTINLLVTDIVMPGMTGVALAEQLRDRYPDLGVLYITGYPREELTRRGVSESVAALNKPFTAESLLEHVRHTLDTRKTSP